MISGGEAELMGKLAQLVESLEKRNQEDTADKRSGLTQRERLKEQQRAQILGEVIATKMDRSVQSQYIQRIYELQLKQSELLKTERRVVSEKQTQQGISKKDIEAIVESASGKTEFEKLSKELKALSNDIKKSSNETGSIFDVLGDTLKTSLLSIASGITTFASSVVGGSVAGRFLKSSKDTATTVPTSKTKPKQPVKPGKLSKLRKATNAAKKVGKAAKVVSGIGKVGSLARGASIGGAAMLAVDYGTEAIFGKSASEFAGEALGTGIFNAAYGDEQEKASQAFTDEEIHEMRKKALLNNKDLPYKERYEQYDKMQKLWQQTGNVSVTRFNEILNEVGEDEVKIGAPKDGARSYTPIQQDTSRFNVSAKQASAIQQLPEQAQQEQTESTIKAYNSLEGIDEILSKYKAPGLNNAQDITLADKDMLSELFHNVIGGVTINTSPDQYTNNTTVENMYEKYGDMFSSQDKMTKMMRDVYTTGRDAELSDGEKLKYEDAVTFFQSKIPQLNKTQGELFSTVQSDDDAKYTSDMINRANALTAPDMQDLTYLMSQQVEQYIEAGMLEPLKEMAENAEKVLYNPIQNVNKMLEDAEAQQTSERTITYDASKPESLSQDDRDFAIQGTKKELDIIDRQLKKLEADFESGKISSRKYDRRKSELTDKLTTATRHLDSLEQVKSTSTSANITDSIDQTPRVEPVSTITPQTSINDMPESGRTEQLTLAEGKSIIERLEQMIKVIDNANAQNNAILNKIEQNTKDAGAKSSNVITNAPTSNTTINSTQKSSVHDIRDRARVNF